MNKNKMKNLTMAAILGGAGVAGCYYLKNNKELMSKMKNKFNNIMKKAGDKLDMNM